MKDDTMSNLTDELIALGYLDAPTTASPAAPNVPAFVPPPTSTEFIPPKWLPKLAIGVIHGRGALLFGPRGSWKSTTIHEFANSIGASKYVLQCFKNMQVDSLIGKMGLAAGNTFLEEGPLTKAYRDTNPKGSWLIAEEPNTADEGVWSVINNVTDDSQAGLCLPTGETVPYNPSFRLIMLYNEGNQYVGTRGVNAALKDRLMPVYATYPEKPDEVRALMNKTGCSAFDADRLVDVANAVRASKCMDLSIRALIRWVQLVQYGVCNWREGYETAIVDLAGSPETATAQRMSLTQIAGNTVDNW